MKVHGRKMRTAKRDKPLPILWQRIAARRGTGKLDHRRIARAAMQLADRGGLDELSMRNLAERLDVGTMSLYRYVRDKDDLKDLILDEAFGEIPVPERVSRNWRRDVAKVIVATRRVMLAHPWLASIAASRPAIGPQYLRWVEFLLAATKAPNRGMKTQLRMIGTVWAFVSGSVAYEVGERANLRRRRETERARRKRTGPYLAEMVRSGKFPCFGEYLRGPEHEPGDEDFQFGLRVVLNGLAVSPSVWAV
jgi:AcrR family transcriptional regulator